MQKTSTTKLVESALMVTIAVAIAAICAELPFMNLPYGGGFTFASMLPVILISYKYGVKWGLLTGVAYAVMQMIMGFDTISVLFLPGDDKMILWKAIMICFIDYILAYTVIGLGGIFRNKVNSTAKALALGSIFALTLRLLCHFVSGSIFYSAYAEWYFTQDGFPAIGQKILDTFSGTTLAMIYSFVYNASYMIPEIIATVLVAVILAKKVPQICKKEA